MHNFSELSEEEQGRSALRFECKLSPTGSILSRQMAKSHKPFRRWSLAGGSVSLGSSY